MVRVFEVEINVSEHFSYLFAFYYSYIEHFTLKKQIMSGNL